MGKKMDVHLCLQIVIFGRSLGGAVAFWVAAANPGLVNSLIVENTFWSIEAVVGKVICPLDLSFGISRQDDNVVRQPTSLRASVRASAALSNFMHLCLLHCQHLTADRAHQMPRMAKKRHHPLCRSHLHIKCKSSIQTCQQWHSHIRGTQADRDAASIDKKACLCCPYNVGQVQSWVPTDADHSRLIASCLIYQAEDQKLGCMLTCPART